MKARSKGWSFLGLMNGFNPCKLAKSAVLLGVAAGALAPGVALADYVKVNDQGVAQIVESEQKPQVLDSNALRETQFDPQKLEEYGLFQLFWNSDVEGTSQQGVWSISPQGVGALLEYAKTNTLDGRPVSQQQGAAEGPIAVTAGNRSLVEHLLNHPYYSAFIAQESVPILRTAFDLPEQEARPVADAQPVDAGEARIATSGQWWGSQGISGWLVKNLPQSMVREYELGSAAGRYSGANTSTEQKAYELGSLLHQFSSSLNRYDDLGLPKSDRIRHTLQEQMLEKFFNLPIFNERVHGQTAKDLKAHFAADFNGSGMGLAQSIVKGFDANDFPVSFPNKGDRSCPVSLSLSTGNLRTAMKKLDEWRVANGMEPRAIWIKDQSAMAYIVGDKPGHYENGLKEKTPFDSKVNFGKLIRFGNQQDGFRTSPLLHDLPVKKGFNFPIDVIKTNGQAVEAWGAEIHVVDGQSGRPVNVELVVHNDADEKPQNWSAKFTDNDGNEIAPDKVKGLIKRGGRVLGDGKAAATLDTGYWGMCDDNTGCNVTFARFGDLPKALKGQAGDGNVYVRAGDKLFAIPHRQGVELIYMDLPGIGSTETPQNAGYRMGYESSKIHWADGNFIYTNTGKIDGFNLSPLHQSNHEWIYEDVMRIGNSAQDPIRGTIRLEGKKGSKTVIPAQNVVSISQGKDGQVEVQYYNEGRSYKNSSKGRLLTELDLDWSQAKLGTSTSSNEPGESHHAKSNETLQSIFEAKVQGNGVTLEQFKEANAALYGRPAASVHNEGITIPGVERTYTVKEGGETIAQLFEGQAKPLAIAKYQFERDNQDLVNQADLILTTGQELTIKIPERTYSSQIDETLQQVWEREAKPAGISFEAFIRANQKLIPAPVHVVADGEVLGTIAQRYEVSVQALQDANQIADADTIGVGQRIKIPVRVQEPGAVTLQERENVTIPASTVKHTVQEGERLNSILTKIAEQTGQKAETLRDRFRYLHHRMFQDWSKLTLPAGAEVKLDRSESTEYIRGEAPSLITDVYQEHVAPLGISEADFKAANEELFGRQAGWIKHYDTVILPERYLEFGDELRGDFMVHRDDGVDVVVKADQVRYIQGETPYDLPFTHYLDFVQKSKGVYGQDGSMTRSISNGRKWVSEITLHQTHGADRPKWAGKKALAGRNGPLERQPGDKIVFAAGKAKTSTVFAGWYQVDEATGSILNEGWTKGEADFAWGTLNPRLNWNASSTYIKEAMSTKLRLQLIVNGIPELRDGGERADEIAKNLQLPYNWQDYIVSKEEVNQFLHPENQDRPAGEEQGGNS